MSSSNCCFLTCIQVSQEAGQVVWYSHLLQNFPQFIVIHTVIVSPNTETWWPHTSHKTYLGIGFLICNTETHGVSVNSHLTVPSSSTRMSISSHFLFSTALITAIQVGMKWQCIVVLTYTSLVIMMLSTFSCAYWSLVYLLWRNVYSNLWPLLKWVVWFFCCWVIRVLCIFWMLILWEIHDF